MATASDERTERCWNLLATLTYADRPLTKSELVAVVGYEGTDGAVHMAFERDKLLLRDQGVPINTTKISSGEHVEIDAYVIDRSWFLPDLDLTDAERRALGAALAAVRFDPGRTLDPGARFGATAGHDVHPLAHLPSVELLADVAAAARANDHVRFDYRGRTRDVDAWRLLGREAAWYLVAWQHDTADQRTFRVDRIESKLTVVGAGEHPPPPGFRAADAFPDNPLLLGGPDDEACEAVVRVDAAHARRAELDPTVRQVLDTDDSGAVRVAIDVVNRHAFRSWLLGYLDHAVVESPDDLRGEVVDHLRTLAGDA